MISADLLKKIQDVVSEPISEKDRAELFVRTLGVYFEQITQLNEVYNAELQDVIKDLKYLEIQKAELSK